MTLDKQPKSFEEGVLETMELADWKFHNATMENFGFAKVSLEEFRVMRSTPRTPEEQARWDQEEDEFYTRTRHNGPRGQTPSK